MPGRKISPEESAAVLALLKRWHQAVAEIDGVSDEMKLIAADPLMGIQSIEYEKSRIRALAVINQVGEETADTGFWPELTSKGGSAILARLKQKLDDSIKCQLNLLRSWGIVSSAFRSGRGNEAPPIEEIMSLNNEFLRALDEMGKVAAELAIHYKIPAKELEKEEAE
jgi:hypothetical protein